MRIACLQFAPQVGDVNNNLNRADAVLSKADPQSLDLLVLPELAFSGYNFRSLEHISPFLEPTTAGTTSMWARTAASRYGCVVTVGYPEKAGSNAEWPASPEYFNSAIIVDADGNTVANYRRSPLYFADEPEGLVDPEEFYHGEIDRLGSVAIAIYKRPSTDLGLCKFEVPWSPSDFGYYIIHKQANLVILSMAWPTREDARSYSRLSKDPDMEALSDWLARFEPIIRAEGEGEIIVVIANRTGIEEEAVYAGTSAVLGIQAGEVKVYGVLGRGEKELLVVDTEKRPKAKLVSEPILTVSDASKQGKDSSNTGSDTPGQSSKPEQCGHAKRTSTTPQSEDHPKEKAHVTLEVSSGPKSPYFPPEIPDGLMPHGRLRSSSGQAESGTPRPDSHNFDRPRAPKSRHASQTRQPDLQQPDLREHDLEEVSTERFPRANPANPAKQRPKSTSW
ncbi:carbon-nitrogen hydrolase [Cadophora sp. DSE1049]|nr:carbon-nitrogen hydrolase [Cadophora sp. DSE1049]